MRKPKWVKKFYIKWGFYPIAGGKDGGRKKAEEGVSQAGATAYERGKATPEEEAAYKGSFQSGGDIEAIDRYRLGLGPAPSGYLSPTEAFLRENEDLGELLFGRTKREAELSPEDLYISQAGEGIGRPVSERIRLGLNRTPTEQYLYETGDVGKALYGQTLAETRDPYAYFQSTLEPQLKKTEDYINRSAQNRGLLRSGIPIEQMGRAGVELAIKEAEARMESRRQALGRAGGLATDITGAGREALNTGYAFGENLRGGYGDAQAKLAALLEYIQGEQKNRMTDLSNIYTQKQQFGLNTLARQANQAQVAAQYQAYPYQARLGDYYGRRSALYALPGQLVGAAGQMMAGIPSSKPQSKAPALTNV